jgi:hypothetical protein
VGGAAEEEDDDDDTEVIELAFTSPRVVLQPRKT